MTTCTSPSNGDELRDRGATRTHTLSKRCGKPSHGENSIAAYWLDTRAGEAVIAGTRYSDSVNGASHAIVIRKEVPRVSVSETDALLTSLYPNPIHQHRSQALTMRVRVESPSQVRFRVLDLLGRIHYTEDLSLLPGQVLLSVSSSRLATLPAGRYRLEINVGSRWESRLLTILP